jgi:hypothetical protein
MKAGNGTRTINIATSLRFYFPPPREEEASPLALDRFRASYSQPSIEGSPQKLTSFPDCTGSTAQPSAAHLKMRILKSPSGICEAIQR